MRKIDMIRNLVLESNPKHFYGEDELYRLYHVCQNATALGKAKRLFRLMIYKGVRLATLHPTWRSYGNKEE